MPTGPGAFDAEGIYLFGESDIESLASDLLNRLGESVSTQLALDRGRLTALEGVRPAIRVTRASNTPALSAASFTNLSTTANWSTTAPAAQRVGGFGAYADGITIPEAGVYDLGYAIVSAGNIAILAGLTINDASAIYQELIAADSAPPVQNVVAVQAHEERYLAEGDVVRLHALAASGTPALLASQGEFYARWVRP